MIQYGQPFKLPPKLKIWEWAERHIELSARYPTKRKGRYSTEYTPYVRGVFDAIQDPRVNRVTVVKASQTGLSLMAYICLCYWAREDPDPSLYVIDTANNARDVSETRIQPLFEDSEYIAEELTDNSDDFKKLHYRLRRSQVDFCGANSPGNLANRPKRRVVLDETGKYPRFSDKEANPVELAIDRTRTYEELKKILEFSTPTVKGCHIVRQGKAADWRRYYVPCPKCGRMQTLEWSRVRFDSSSKSIADAAKKAAYVCISRKCKHRWTDSEKCDAVDQGRWRKSKKSEDPTHVSFHLSSLYSKSTTWAGLVTKFLKAKGNAADLMDFVNSELAEEWTEPPKKQFSKNKIVEIQKRLVYDQGTVPTHAPCHLVMVVDVQAAHLPFHVWAMDLSNHWLIDHGSLVDFTEIPNQFAMEYHDLDKLSKRPLRCFLDCRYRTMEAYSFALAHPWVVPIMGEKGRLTRQMKPVVPSQINSFPGGKLFGGRRSLRLLHLHPSQFKNQLSDALSGDGNVKIWFHRNVSKDDGFLYQMVGEVLMESEPNKYGDTEQFWKKVHANDDFDLAQYSFAVRHLSHSDLMRLPKTKKQKEVEQKKHQTKVADISVSPNDIRL